MSILPYKAMSFAITKHKAQRRKYINTDYSEHLAEVAGIVATISDYEESLYGLAPGTMIAVSWLHDVAEDQDVEFEELRINFGDTVAHGVFLLSDLEEGNRAARAEASRNRLADAPGWLQSIKCADSYSNTKSILRFDPKFAEETYIPEKKLLLPRLAAANTPLLKMAMDAIGLEKE